MECSKHVSVGNAKLKEILVQIQTMQGDNIKLYHKVNCNGVE
jgi:hypothetical protein